jgi:hypothetical protein
MVAAKLAFHYNNTKAYSFFLGPSLQLPLSVQVSAALWPQSFHCASSCLLFLEVIFISFWKKLSLIALLDDLREEPRLWEALHEKENKKVITAKFL